MKRAKEYWPNAKDFEDAYKPDEKNVKFWELVLDGTDKCAKATGDLRVSRKFQSLLNHALTFRNVFGHHTSTVGRSMVRNYKKKCGNFSSQGEEFHSLITIEEILR